METLDLLRQLSQASGVSGYEEEVRQIARAAFQPHTDDLLFAYTGDIAHCSVVHNALVFALVLSPVHPQA